MATNEDKIRDVEKKLNNLSIQFSNLLSTLNNDIIIKSSDAFSDGITKSFDKVLSSINNKLKKANLNKLNIGFSYDVSKLIVDINKELKQNKLDDLVVNVKYSKLDDLILPDLISTVKIAYSELEELSLPQLESKINLTYSTLEDLNLPQLESKINLTYSTLEDLNLPQLESKINVNIDDVAVALQLIRDEINSINSLLILPKVELPLISLPTEHTINILFNLDDLQATVESILAQHDYTIDQPIISSPITSPTDEFQRNIPIIDGNQFQIETSDVSAFDAGLSKLISDIIDETNKEKLPQLFSELEQSFIKVRNTLKQQLSSIGVEKIDIVTMGSEKIKGLIPALKQLKEQLIINEKETLTDEVERLKQSFGGVFQSWAKVVSNIDDLSSMQSLTDRFNEFTVKLNRLSQADRVINVEVEIDDEQTKAVTSLFDVLDDEKIFKLKLDDSNFKAIRSLVQDRLKSMLDIKLITTEHYGYLSRTLFGENGVSGALQEIVSYNQLINDKFNKEAISLHLQYEKHALDDLQYNLQMAIARGLDPTKALDAFTKAKQEFENKLKPLKIHAYVDEGYNKMIYVLRNAKDIGNIELLDEKSYKRWFELVEKSKKEKLTLLEADEIETIAKKYKKYFASVEVKEFALELGITDKNTEQKIKEYINSIEKSISAGEIDIDSDVFAIQQSTFKDTITLLDTINKLKAEDANYFFNLGKNGKELSKIQKELNRLLEIQIKTPEKITSEQVTQIEVLKDQLDELNKKNQETQRLFSKFEDAMPFADLKEEIKDLMTGMVDFATRPLAAIGILGGTLYAQFISPAIAGMEELGGSATDLTKLTRTSVAAAFDLRSIAEGVSYKESMESAVALTKALGSSTKLTKNMVRETSILAERYGMGADNAAALFVSLNSLHGKSSDITSNQLEQLGIMAKQANIPLGELASDIAASTEYTAKWAGKGLNNFVKTAIAAKKLGASLSDVEKISSSLLDFESSIEKELQFQVLSGKAINLNAARDLMFRGKQEEGLNEVLRLMGGVEEFNNMNVYAQDAAADLLNIELAQLKTMLAERQRIYEQQYKLNDSISAFDKMWGRIAEQTSDVGGWLKENAMTIAATANVMGSLGNQTIRFVKWLKAGKAIELWSNIASGAKSAIGWIKALTAAKKASDVISTTTKIPTMLGGEGATLMRGGFEAATGGGVGEIAKTATQTVADELKESAIDKAKEAAGEKIGELKDSATDKSKEILSEKVDSFKEAATDKLKGATDTPIASPKTNPIVDWINTWKRMSKSALKNFTLAAGVMVVSLAGLALVMRLFIGVPWDAAAMAMGSLIGMAFSMKLLGKMKKGILEGALSMLILSAAMIPLAYAFSLLGDIDPLAILALVAAVPLLGLAMVGLGALMSSLVGGALFLTGVAAILALGGALVLLGMGIKMVAPHIDTMGEKLKNFMVSIKDLDISGLKTFFNNIKELDTTGLKRVSSDIKSFSKGTTMLTNLGQALYYVGSSLEHIGKHINNLSELDIITNKLAALANSTNDIRELALSINSLANSLIKYSLVSAFTGKPISIVTQPQEVEKQPITKFEREESNYDTSKPTIKLDLNSVNEKLDRLITIFSKGLTLRVQDGSKLGTIIFKDVPSVGIIGGR